MALTQVERNNKLKNKRYKFIFSYFKDNPCVDCGESDPLVLDFDHIDGKNDNISNMIRDSKPLHRILKEMDLCVVRCSNCHRKRTCLSKMSVKAKAYIDFYSI